MSFDSRYVCVVGDLYGSYKTYGYAVRLFSSEPLD